jgi:hypothetical protein
MRYTTATAAGAGPPFSSPSAHLAKSRTARVATKLQRMLARSLFGPCLQVLDAQAIAQHTNCVATSRKTKGHGFYAHSLCPRLVKTEATRQLTNFVASSGILLLCPFTGTENSRYLVHIAIAFAVISYTFSCRQSRCKHFSEMIELLLSCLPPGSCSDSQLLRSSVEGGPYHERDLAFHRALAWSEAEFKLVQERDFRFRYLFSCAPIAGRCRRGSGWNLKVT